jgi:hypothetical protein
MQAIKIRQYKHHRWRLNGGQVRQYSLGSVLDPKKRWWEHIAVPRRSVEFVAFGPSLTMTVLICEDLAQSDPIGDVIRAVGPNLVIALLADGPQTSGRWASRYASVLADDPGCSVLSLTSTGMARLSRPAGGQENSASIALWKDAVTGVTEICPPPDTDGIVLSISIETEKQACADGRHRSACSTARTLTLGGVHYLSLKEH